MEPTWKVLEQFVVHDLQNVFGLDALQSSHPISIEVGHPDEIGEIFDTISYEKGIPRDISFLFSISHLFKFRSFSFRVLMPQVLPLSG